MMKKLLVHIGTHHPQAVIFPLVFESKSKNQNRKSIANQIIKDIIKNPNNDLSKIKPVV
jgi:hypothetical protein